MKKLKKIKLEKTLNKNRFLKLENEILKLQSGEATDFINLSSDLLNLKQELKADIQNIAKNISDLQINLNFLIGICKNQSNDIKQIKDDKGV